MPQSRIKVMISSTVYKPDFEATIRQMAAVLGGFGFDVLSNVIGSIVERPGQTVPEACLEAVDDCDYFIGIVRGYYGSAQQGKTGLGDDEISVTHLEQRRAIALQKPRTFFVEQRLETVREVLKPVLGRLSTTTDATGRTLWALSLAANEPNPYQGSEIISDLRVFAMLDDAQRGSGGPWPGRTNNWCQRFRGDGEILNTLTALFQDEDRLRADLAAYAAQQQQP